MFFDDRTDVFFWKEKTIKKTERERKVLKMYTDVLQREDARGLLFVKMHSRIQTSNKTI